VNKLPAGAWACDEKNAPESKKVKKNDFTAFII
jgi:hypothetical protein